MVCFPHMESQTHSKGGRPTKYKSEFEDGIITFFEDYLLRPTTREVTKEITKYYKDGEKKETINEYKIVPRGLPTLFAYARSIGCNYDTVRAWAHDRVGTKPEAGKQDKRPYKYPEFSASYKQAVHFQTEYLIKVGMGGLAPSSFAIFTAKNVIGWRDKNEIGFTDPNGQEAKPGYIILPARKSDDDAMKEYTNQEQEAETPTL